MISSTLLTAALAFGAAAESPEPESIVVGSVTINPIAVHYSEGAEQIAVLIEIIDTSTWGASLTCETYIGQDGLPATREDYMGYGWDSGTYMHGFIFEEVQPGGTIHCTADEERFTIDVPATSETTDAVLTLVPATSEPPVRDADEWATETTCINDSDSGPRAIAALGVVWVDVGSVDADALVDEFYDALFDVYFCAFPQQYPETFGDLDVDIQFDTVDGWNILRVGDLTMVMIEEDDRFYLLIAQDGGE